MPRAANGDYTLPTNSFNPAVEGTTIDPDAWNATGDDIAEAMTDSLSRNGDGGMLADLELDDNAIVATEIATPANPAANNLKVYALDDGGTTKLAYLDSAGTETILSAAGTGDVTGPASSTDNAIARYNLTTGKIIQDSVVTVADNTGIIDGSQGINIAGSASGAVALRVPAAAGSNTLTLPAGTTDFSATGGASQVVKQTSAGGAFTVGTVGVSDLAGLGTGVGTFLATPSSANLASAVTDETGSGALVFGTAPTLTAATLATRLIKGIYILGASAVAASHTGTTGEVTLATITVPANSMGANGILRITSQWTMSGAGGTRTPRMKFNGTSFNGITMALGTLSARIQSQIANRNATNSQVGNQIDQANWSANTTGAAITSAHDTTGALDVTITGQLANSGDTITLESYLVELIVP
jgi:hypothetical protein